MTLPQHSQTAPIEAGPGPDGVVRLPASGRHAALRAAVAVLLLVAAVMCARYSTGFPEAAPVEDILAQGLVLDMGLAGLTLLVCAAYAGTAESRRIGAGSISGLAVASAIIIGVALFGFASTVPNWLSVIGGTRGRYDGLTLGLFMVGIPWATGVVLATNSLRKPGRVSRMIGGAAAAIGVLLAVPAIAATALYGAGITD